MLAVLFTSLVIIRTSEVVSPCIYVFFFEI